MPEPMTDERLREIAGGSSCPGPFCDDERRELLAEVKRLRAENARFAEQNAAWKRLADSNGMAVGIRYD